MKNTINRMGDVVLALREAEHASVFPTRIQLQKFVYLADVLGQIVGVFKPLAGHKTYQRGPYDAAIQNAVDSLAFRGMARIEGVWRMPNGGLATKYQITDSGRDLLVKMSTSPYLQRKIRIASLIGVELKHFGWNRIVKLVYAEPTYVAARPKGWGVALMPENGVEISTAFLVAIMRRVVETLDNEREATPEWITNRFFAFLSDYDYQNGNISQNTI